MKKSNFIILATVFLLLLSTSFCSLKKMAMNEVADILASPGGSTVFTGDNDPELVGDALPFAIKMYESLLESLPVHRGLQLRTGSIYIVYANAFLQTPASMLTEDEYKKQEFLLQRAKNLYLRGRNILLNALDREYPGFKKNLNDQNYEIAFKSLKKEDTDFLYWAAAGWLGAFAIDPFDMKLGITLPRAKAMMEKVMELDDQFGNGSIHDFYTLYYGSMPDYMGGDFKKARYHFKKAVKMSEGKLTSPYLSLATSVSIKEQNVEEFKSLLNKVLEIDPDLDNNNRLLNTLNIRKARWYLEHIDDFFLLEDEEYNNQDETNPVEKEER
jgi:predicted anti-sigma-YlaC factor YlaD